MHGNTCGRVPHGAPVRTVGTHCANLVVVGFVSGRLDHYLVDVREYDKFATAADAIADILDDEIVSMGYEESDIKVYNCAK